MEQVWRDDACRVADGDHAACTDGSRRRAGDGRGSVRDEGHDGGIGARNHEDSDIAAAHARHCCEEDVAYGDEQGRSDDMLAYDQPCIDKLLCESVTYRWALLLAVRVPGIANDDKERKGIGRYGEQLRLV